MIAIRATRIADRIFGRKRGRQKSKNLARIAKIAKIDFESQLTRARKP